MAGNNIKVEADGRIHTINHAGVALHPSDEGMKVYADRLYNAVCQYEKEKESATKANNAQSSNQLTGGNMKLDENKILFVVQKQNEDNYTACIQSIQDLKIPKGKKTEICTWSLTKPDASYSQLYNAVIAKNNAKYKIYLPDTTCFVYEKALLDMLSIMESDCEIGMLGVCGAKSLPVSGIWQEAEHKLGELYVLQADGNVSETKYDAPEAEYEEVQSISTVIVATQHDLVWKDVANGDLCAAAQSLEFIRQGYKVVVPAQTQTWCLSMAGEKDDLSQTNALINEYAGYLSSDGLVMSNEAMLQNFGINAVLGTDCQLTNPAKISIGDDVAIGDNCCFTANEQIDIEHDVIIEDNVRLDDGQIAVLDNVPAFGKCFEQSSIGRILVGHHSHIEPNVQLQGSISIGCGCLIKANSVVDIDIPNHCVAAGNPARVIRAMDYEDGKWVAINSVAELEQLLEKRRNTKPILTIGIPTYNRSYYLHKCLRHIYKQVGNDDLVEVMVSDNASIDNTAGVSVKYTNHYKNLVYHRNKENIGAEKNFRLLWEKAGGRYIEVLGDDDYLVSNAIYRIISSLYKNVGSSVFCIQATNEVDADDYCGIGMDEYVKRISYISTYISGIILKKECYKKIKDKNKFSETSLPQVYIQLEILKNNPEFVVLYVNAFIQGSGESGFDRKLALSDKHPLARVFIQEYYDILNYFVGDKVNLLSRETLKQDKINVVRKFLLPWCDIVTANDSIWKLDDDILLIIDKYYHDEAYCNDLKKHIAYYLNKQNGEL